MDQKRIYRTFTHKEAVLRIACGPFDAVKAEVVRQRALLERYIESHPGFHDSLAPVAVRAGAPEVARRMARAARKVGVGPMAAVAGAMAQLAVEAALGAGADEAIVDNGGDIFLQAAGPVTIGLYPGGGPEGIGRLAFALDAADTPLSICSSSGKMGHSLSLGRCDLATVVARDGALADAAATLAANLVSAVGDVERALERIVAIDGVRGVLIVKDGHVGLAGKLPPLVRRAS